MSYVSKLGCDKPLRNRQGRQPIMVAELLHGRIHEGVLSTAKRESDSLLGAGGDRRTDGVSTALVAREVVKELIEVLFKL